MTEAEAAAAPEGMQYNDMTGMPDTNLLSQFPLTTVPDVVPV